MPKYERRYASSPLNTDVEAWTADAAATIKARLEVICDLDPRKPLLRGDLVAICKGLELSYQKRGEVGSLSLIAVSARPEGKTDAPWVYLGNEVRCSDGKVVAQRWRSPEAATAFRNASTQAERNSKEANLFMTNWCDEQVVDHELAKKFVVRCFPSDMKAGIAYRLGWYCDKHMADCGRVDLRAAMPALCKALDDADAEAKAKADAEAKAKDEAAEALKATAKGLLHRRGNRAHPEHFRTVALWRAACREAGIPGIGPKATDGAITEALNIAAGYYVPEPVVEPTRAIVTAEEHAAIVIAVNTVDREDGVSRLWRALKAAGVAFKVPETKEATKALLLEIARNCEVAKTAGELAEELDTASAAAAPVEA